MTSPTQRMFILPFKMLSRLGTVVAILRRARFSGFFRASLLLCIVGVSRFLRLANIYFYFFRLVRGVFSRLLHPMFLAFRASHGQYIISATTPRLVFSVVDVLSCSRLYIFPLRPLRFTLCGLSRHDLGVGDFSCRLVTWLIYECCQRCRVRACFCCALIVEVSLAFLHCPLQLPGEQTLVAM